MSANPVHAARLSLHTAAPGRPVLPPRPHVPVAGALRAVESFLLSGGQQTARRNAWAAVVADRQRARDRREAEHELAALVSGARQDATRD
jgi:hypothetical protein